MSWHHLWYVRLYVAIRYPWWTLHRRPIYKSVCEFLYSRAYYISRKGTASLFGIFCACTRFVFLRFRLVLDCEWGDCLIKWRSPTETHLVGLFFISSTLGSNNFHPYDVRFNIYVDPDLNLLNYPPLNTYRSLLILASDFALLLWNELRGQFIQLALMQTIPFLYVKDLRERT